MKLAAGAIALLALTMLAPSLAHAVSATWPITVSAPSSNNVVLDSTTFTGGRPGTTADGSRSYDGTMLVANISNSASTAATYAMSACPPAGHTAAECADNSKFSIETTGWTNSSVGGSRVGPFLVSKAAVQANGFKICITGTGGGSYTNCFSIGDPPAPTINAVTVLNSGGNIDSAISGQSSGGTVFLNPGTYSCPSSLKAGVNLVSATVQNQLRGQTSSAVINCGYGGFQSANNVIIYGVVFNNVSISISGTNGFTLRNLVINNHGTGLPSGKPNATCRNGTSNFTMEYVSLIDAHNDANCGGGESNLLVQNNYYLHCDSDCHGPHSQSDQNDRYLRNMIWEIQPNANDSGCGSGGICNGDLGCFIEHDTSGSTQAGTEHILDNWMVNGFQYSWSLIGDMNPMDFEFNYTAGNAHIEWQAGSASAGFHDTEKISHNYFDNQNWPANESGRSNGAFYGIQGPYQQGGGDTALEIDNRENGGINDVDGFGSCGMPCQGEFAYSGGQFGYQAGPTSNIGVPRPWVAGSSAG